MTSLRPAEARLIRVIGQSLQKEISSYDTNGDSTVGPYEKKTFGNGWSPQKKASVESIVNALQPWTAPMKVDVKLVNQAIQRASEGTLADDAVVARLLTLAMSEIEEAVRSSSVKVDPSKLKGDIRERYRQDSASLKTSHPVSFRIENQTYIGYQGTTRNGDVITVAADSSGQVLYPLP